MDTVHHAYDRALLLLVKISSPDQLFRPAAAAAVFLPADLRRWWAPRTAMGRTFRPRPVVLGRFPMTPAQISATWRPHAWRPHGVAAARYCRARGSEHGRARPGGRTRKGTMGTVSSAARLRRGRRARIRARVRAPHGPVISMKNRRKYPCPLRRHPPGRLRTGTGAQMEAGEEGRGH